MARASLNLEIKELPMHNQARNSIQYSLLNHETNEFKTLPIDPNLMTFSDRRINNKYLQTLYLEPYKLGLSREFEYNLIIFYLYITFTSIVILGTSGFYYSQGLMCYNIFIFHVTCIFFILIFAYVLLIGISRSIHFRLNNRNLLCVLGCLWCFYLIIGSQNIINKIIGEDDLESRMHFSIAIVGFVYYYRLVIFDSFKHVMIPIVGYIVLAIVMDMVFSQSTKTEVVSEYFLCVIVLILQIVECQKVSSRSLQLFFRYYNEELKGQIIEEGDQGSVLEVVSNTELIVDKCEKVIKEVENVRKVIIYNDIKSRMKLSISMLREIKKYLGKYGRSETVRFADNSNMDIEDKEFISQNFLNVKKPINERSKERHGTLRDFVERRSHFSLSAAILSENVGLLETLGRDWNFDTLDLHQKLGRSISLIGKHLFHKWCLGDLLSTTQDVAYRLFENIEIVRYIQNYQNNPYHNAIHAADVFNSLYYFITSSDIEKVMTPHESIACLLAALSHDVGHPGLTNRYLIASKHTLSMRYNDISVLENMHCSMLYTLLSEPECNMLSNIGDDLWKSMRKLIIDMILQTDMSRHFEILGKFRARAVSINDLNIDNIDDRGFVLGIGLKCADLGHSAKTFQLHERWTYLVCEEFFHQGDLEKANDMPVSMYCDRETTDIPKSQNGFLKNVCLPLYEVFSNYLKIDAIQRNCVEQIKENLNRWDEISKNKQYSQVTLIKSKEDFLVKVMTRKNT